MKTVRLNTIHAVFTLGEFAWSVWSRSWTIQGCRPISVRTQPAVAAMYGNAIATRAVHWNQRAVSSFRFRYSHAPTAATRNISTPMYAMTRIDQYMTRTFGM